MNDSSTRQPASPLQSNSPLVSVLMPMWNSERHLGEAIESVRAQTEDRWELLLIDDGSHDSSLLLALRFAEMDPERIRILRHPSGANRGSSASRNLGLRHSRGHFVTFLDADDVWLPHCLDTQLQVMQEFPEAAMVFGAAERWCHLNQPYDEARARAAWWGENYIPPTVPTGFALGVLPAGALLDWYLADESMVPCICCVLMRTSVARAVGGFEEQFAGLYDDQAFHAKVALAHTIVAHGACLARYRQHAGSCCAEARDNAPLQSQGRARFLSWLAAYRSRGLRETRPQLLEQPQS